MLLRTRIGLPFSEHSMDTRHPFAYEDMLRTQILTLTALDACTGPAAFIQSRVLLSRQIELTGYSTQVVHAKIVRYPDPVRTRHAVATLGARNREKPTVLVTSLSNSGKITF